MEPDSDYDSRQSRTYLLRFWREHATAPWRVALRSADNDDVRGFADLEELLAFLQRAITATPARPQPGLRNPD